MRKNTFNIGGIRTRDFSFLSSALEGGEWSASRPSRFNPEEGAASGPQTQYGRGSEKKINPLPRIEPHRSRLRGVTLPTEQWRSVVFMKVK
jgi:hypothetical protein